MTTNLEFPTSEKIAGIVAELRDEYCQPHSFPWVIGFSGGKDSTLVLHLVFDLLVSLPKSERRREVHVVANDTMVESPLVISHIRMMQERIVHASAALHLPVRFEITHPTLDQTFWVNLIGRGYPAPSRSFRWCTDRMKIQPTSRYIGARAAAYGNVVLLLGVRRSESAARAKSAKRYGEARLNPHNDLPGCLVFRPILELETDEVWEALGSLMPPWGGRHTELFALYRDADGGECPVVTAKSDAPSCGTSSSRFGCWTCTVVEKDKSLTGFIDSGYTTFSPLLRFRDWLKDFRDDMSKRQARRRKGGYTFLADGRLIPGPFTLEARNEILDHLLAVQEEMRCELISKEEIARIKAIWMQDLIDVTEELSSLGVQNAA